MKRTRDRAGEGREYRAVIAKISRVIRWMGLRGEERCRRVGRLRGACSFSFFPFCLLIARSFEDRKEGGG